MLTFVRTPRRRRAVESGNAVHDPTTSRAGAAAAGMRPGDASRFRPSQGEQALGDRLGVKPYDPTERRL